MLLAIDVGNSNLSAGVFQEETLLMKGKISVRTSRSADEYAAVLYDLMRMNHISREQITGCILATGGDVLRVGPGIRTGFRIGIDDPSQLGGDLAANTLAGLTEYGAPLVVVDAGTVTAIIAVDKDRTYLGGCILPGIRLSAQLLKGTTALLPSIELGSGEEDCLGRNSADAMRCGLLLGSAMMVDGFVDRYAALPGMAGAKCVATGGCARELIRDPELTLKGLRYLYELNRPKKR